ncbi:MAG: hypothetical protein LC796_17460 [Acidobacteria bacterium]|nr:hypothetical protein [Acidobacteriota bacterium]MCA1610742.1 hypothetical protein [Acidobacteriota bacterium]
MKRGRRFLAIAIAGMLAVGMLAVGDAASAAPKGGQGKGKEKGKHEHQNGKQLVGEKIKTNGRHVIHQKGDYTAAVDVRDGKIAGVHVTHPKKGEVAVKKYRTNKKMARRTGQAGGFQYASLTQDQYLGTTYIGFAYVDEYGDEEIYWFPYDMILDGDTGAVEYVPVV